MMLLSVSFAYRKHSMRKVDKSGVERKRDKSVHQQCWREV